MNSHTVLRLISALVSFLALGPAFPSTTQGPLQLNVSLEQETNDVVMRFVLTNASTSAVTITPSQLPWGSQIATTIVVVPERKDPLRRMFGTEDVFRESPIKIIPGQSLAGEVSLAGQFQDLMSIVTKSRVVVFWFYEPEQINGLSMGSYGGWAITRVTNELQHPDD